MGAKQEQDGTSVGDTQSAGGPATAAAGGALPRTGVLVLVVALVLGVLAGLAPSAAAATPGQCDPDPVLCPERIYVGASVPRLMSDPAALDAFTAAVGVSPSVAMTFARLGDRPDPAALQRLADAGRLPMLTWEPYDYTNPTAEPFPLRDITAGRFDAAIRSSAQAVAGVDAPVAIRFAHEMNGSWYPWGLGVNGNTAADYVAAYRHVHDVVTAAGATNVVWVWAPNLVEGPSISSNLAGLYPGDEYVDWVALDGYFNDPADTFATVFPPTLRLLDQVAPTKPLYVAETAVLPGANRPAMIRDLVTGLLATPRLVGFTWFDWVTQADWRIETDPTAAAALATQLESPWFGGAGEMDDPVAGAPLKLAAPAVNGAAVAGRVLTSTTGVWRSGSGAVTYSGRWYRCTGSTSVSSCTATTSTATSYTVLRSDYRKYLRFAVAASNASGGTVAWSAPTKAVVMTPVTPKPPAVEARDHALHIRFPAAPAGTTHWRLSINGTAKPLVAVSTRDYWLTGLGNGHSYGLGLAAVSVSSAGRLASASTKGLGVPMTAPWRPSVTVSGTSMTVKLPSRVPTGATAWQLTVGSVTRTLSTSAKSVTVTGLPKGKTTTWGLRAAAGSWSGQRNTSRTPPASGHVVAR